MGRKIKKHEIRRENTVKCFETPENDMIIIFMTIVAVIARNTNGIGKKILKQATKKQEKSR